MQSKFGYTFDDTKLRFEVKNFLFQKSVKETLFAFGSNAVSITDCFCVISLVLYFDYISSDLLSVPSLMVNGVTNSAVQYYVQTDADIANSVITGNKVTRFGVPMIGEYVKVGTSGTISISPAVPGAQYKITAWALGNGNRRSATPALEDATTGEASMMKYKYIELETTHIIALAIIVLAGSIGDSKPDYVSTYTLFSTSKILMVRIWCKWT